MAPTLQRIDVDGTNPPQVTSMRCIKTNGLSEKVLAQARLSLKAIKDVYKRGVSISPDLFLSTALIPTSPNELCGLTYDDVIRAYSRANNGVVGDRAALQSAIKHKVQQYGGSFFVNERGDIEQIAGFRLRSQLKSNIKIPLSR